MAVYKIVFKKSVAKDVAGIPSVDLQKILSRIEGLASDPRPHGAAKLTGQEAYRLRQGNYRIIYEIDDLVVLVTVIKIGHRRDVYR